MAEPPSVAGCSELALTAAYHLEVRALSGVSSAGSQLIHGKRAAAAPVEMTHS
jgi:hypothetical protein